MMQKKIDRAVYYTIVVALDEKRKAANTRDGAPELSEYPHVEVLTVNNVCADLQI